MKNTYISKLNSSITYPYLCGKILQIKLNKTIWVAGLVVALCVMFLQSYSSPSFLWREVNYLSQPYDIRGLAKGSVFSVSYLLSVLAVITAVFSKNKYFAYGALVWIFITYAVDLFVQYMGSYRGFSTEELTIAISQVHLISNMKSYLFEILVCGLITLILVGFIVFVRRKVKLRFTVLWASLFCVLALIAVHFSAKKVNTILLNGYPAPIKSGAIIYNYIIQESVVENRLLPDHIVPIHSPTDKNIIWVIDESVTGSFLGINGYEKQTTPFLTEELQQNPNLRNLGVVNSISNCSNYSNLFLRTGMTTNKEYKVLNNLPSILSYAKNAGYKIVMLDSQITAGEMTNFLTPEEMSLIDELHTLDRSVIPAERDLQMNNELAAILDKNQKDRLFVIYIKFGCHWPYLLNFDNTKAAFLPIQPSTFTRMVPENKELIVNTYLNSIYHNVDLFFKDLIKKVSPQTNYLIYTSDHGQSILESDTPRTHCSNNVETIPLNEFNVPLIIFTTGQDSVRQNDQHSQIQIYPTTLQLMGYDSTIYKDYGPTLDENMSKRQSWITGTGKKVDFR